MKKVLFLAFSSLMLVSCTKEIQVDLNTSDPKLVVEATLHNQTDTASVLLSRTVNFSEPNRFPSVTDASVVIKDSEGNSWNLVQTSPGVYQHFQLRGVIGRTYSLEITLNDGQVFTAQSTLPEPVTLDKVEFIERTFGAPGSDNDSINYFVLPRFLDPAGIQNNYRFVQTLNGVKDHTIQVRNDNIFSGRVNEQPLINPDLDIHSGDEVLLEMQCIDVGVYNYFFSLSQSIGGGGPNAAAVPANPVSNISGGALGFFAAYSVQKLTVLAP
jgi:hypothetical protein